MSAGSAYVLLEDGARFGGEAAAADGPVTGEVVFNTAMSGYQEAVTDPSYAGQIVTFTYPHVGNYGVSGDAMESDRVHARAVIMRAAVNAKHGRSRRPAGRPLPLEDALAAEGGWLDWLRDCGVPAITGVDTRALVRHLRDRGAMRGGIFPADLAQDEAADRLMAEPPMAGQDLAREVSPDRVLEVGSGDGPRIAAIDTGIKQSIVHNLVARGARVALHPCTATPDDLLASDPDAIFLANGPGDPAALSYVVETVRALVGRRPVWGICLGHQLLCRAVGLETFKL
ncbi:MAG: carbamoyl phosphate synthase small subunit, partial [Solirubrobacteraceae bacterium]